MSRSKIGRYGTLISIISAFNRLTFRAVIRQQTADSRQQTVTGDKGINVSVGMLLQEGDMNRKEV